jgi:hypothetical protein
MFRTARRGILPGVVALLFCTAAQGDGPTSNPPPKAAPPTGELRSLDVYPVKITLMGPRDEQRVVVTGRYADGRQWDLTRAARFACDTPAVAVAEPAGMVRPTGEGRATLNVQAAGKTASVPVRVHAMADTPVDFVREIMPVLTKAGCNQGACHGAQHGRGGFRLSLRGFDPVFDYSQIVQSAEGRRVVLSDPERSILLLKPALVMEHGGGERLKAGSRGHNLLKQWLEDGVPEPSTQELTTARLDVFPPRRVMVPGEQQQILARAVWSDSLTEDVTGQTQFDSLNDSVAKVSPDGLITALGQGETHVMLRFNGQVAVVQVTLPFAAPGANAPGAAAWVNNNFIDAKLRAKWRDLGLTPSPLCGDEEFFRRIHLDAIGTLPTPADIRTFLADKSTEKRQRAIDRVLERPEFIDFWALKWGDLLRINRDQLEEKGMWSFYNWLRAELRDNKPVDAFVRDIVTAEGSTFTEGPANFYRVSRDPLDWAEATAQTFLGVRMQCAKCHHHPFEKWSQDDYYGMAAFFVRLGTKNSQEFGLFGRETVVFLRPNGEQSHPRKGGVVKPHPLDGPAMDDPFDRRRKLAEWLTAKGNPFFARNVVNRFWGYLMGRGLVEPLDDMRATNPASIPDLLDGLAADFAGHSFDLKHLLRTVLNSRAYQLSSAVSPGNAADSTNVYHTRYTVKRLTAEQLADALDFATGTREKYQGLPLGTRAIQLPDTRVRSFLLDVFGRPPRQITCECERTAQPNIAQALHLLNGDVLNKKIAAPTGRIETLLKNKTPLPAVIEELYLTTLSRPPRSEELTKAMGWINEAPTPQEGAQDVFWALLNSREFLFNH